MALLAAVSYVLIAPGIVDTKQAHARQQLMVLRAALARYRADNGRYPSQEEGLPALVDPTPNGRYLTSEFALKDPWGRPIVYRLDGERFTLRSLGPGGVQTGSPDQALTVHN